MDQYSDFGRPAGEITARLAFVNFDGAQNLAAAERQPKEQPLYESFLRHYCRNTMTVIQSIAEWFSSL